MEQASRDAFTGDVKALIFRALGLVEQEWQDLGGFESFVFAHAGKKQILRLTHNTHRSADDIAAELEFLRFLAAEGAAVCSPEKLVDQDWIVVDEFVCCVFTIAPGKQIAQADWSPSLIENWGAAIGRFHKLSSLYQPIGPRRFDWREDANLNFRGMIPAEQEGILKLGDDYLAKLDTLKVSEQNYGLIHSDAHAGNFFLSEGELRFFDFDDCCYQWFVFDVATILFSAVLQPWMADDQTAREATVKKFLPSFFLGYGREKTVDSFLIEQLPLFLKLREFSLYGVINSHMDVNNLVDWYPIKFMSGRRERMEQDLPYMNVDFADFLN